MYNFEDLIIPNTFKKQGGMKLARSLVLQEGSFKVLSGRARGRGEDMSDRKIGIKVKKDTTYLLS